MRVWYGVWYCANTIEGVDVLRSFMVGGKIILGASMVDGRYISSVGWEDGYLVFSAEYRS